jgi:ATP-dependent Clp protease, protease subunit
MRLHLPPQHPTGPARRPRADEPDDEPGEAAPVIPLRPGFPDTVADRLLRQRRVMLTGPIDMALAGQICSQLLLLEAEDPDEAITLYVNSPGGEVDAGFAIYDTMQALTCDVATVCYGLAASMAQFVLCGGAAGRRAAQPHARILMHQPHGSVQGRAIDIEIQAQQFEFLRQRMAELIAHHSGQDVERILADFDRDRWFTAQEAQGYGLVDHVLAGPGPRRAEALASSRMR